MQGGEGDAGGTGGCGGQGGKVDCTLIWEALVGSSRSITLAGISEGRYFCGVSCNLRCEWAKDPKRKRQGEEVSREDKALVKDLGQAETLEQLRGSLEGGIEEEVSREQGP